MSLEQVELLSCEKSFCEEQSLGVPRWDISQELALCPLVAARLSPDPALLWPSVLSLQTWDLLCPERGGSSGMSQSGAQIHSPTAGNASN